MDILQCSKTENTCWTSRISTVMVTLRHSTFVVVYQKIPQLINTGIIVIIIINILA